MMHLPVLLTSIQRAEIICLTLVVLFVLYIMHSLNLFKRE